MKNLIFLSLVFLAGCSTASLVEKTFDPKGGSVELGSTIYKEKGKKIMTEYCEGDFQILSEREGYKPFFVVFQDFYIEQKFVCKK